MAASRSCSSGVASDGVEPEGLAQESRERPRAGPADRADHDLQPLDPAARALRAEHRMGADNVDMIGQFAPHDLGRQHFDRADVEHRRAGAQMRPDGGDRRAELRHGHGEYDEVAGCGGRRVGRSSRLLTPSAARIRRRGRRRRPGRRRKPGTKARDAKRPAGRRRRSRSGRWWCAASLPAALSGARSRSVPVQRDSLRLVVIARAREFVELDRAAAGIAACHEGAKRKKRAEPNISLHDPSPVATNPPCVGPGPKVKPRAQGPLTLKKN